MSTIRRSPTRSRSGSKLRGRWAVGSGSRKTRAAIGIRAIPASSASREPPLATTAPLNILCSDNIDAGAAITDRFPDHERCLREGVSLVADGAGGALRRAAMADNASPRREINGWHE